MMTRSTAQVCSMEPALKYIGVANKYWIGSNLLSSELHASLRWSCLINQQCHNQGVCGTCLVDTQGEGLISFWDTFWDEGSSILGGFFGTLIFGTRYEGLVYSELFFGTRDGGLSILGGARRLLPGLSWVPLLAASPRTQPALLLLVPASDQHPPNHRPSA